MFEYDSRGRRIRQTVWNDRDDGQGSELSDVLYLYDGWNLIAELNANASNAKVRTAMWGLDTSGSEQGAGGVGGLLQVAYFGSATTNCFAAFDGNGNVAVLVNAANGETVAQYEYGPLGELIRATGPMAKANPFRFSTKFQDSESDMLYYGYRFYNQSTGRWPNRDPIGEVGFETMRRRPALPLAGEPSRYLFVRNNPISRIDYLGLEDWLNGEFVMKAEWGMQFTLFATDTVTIGFPWGVSYDFFGMVRVTPITVKQASGKQPGEVFLPPGATWIGDTVFYETLFDGPKKCGATGEPRWYGTCWTQYYCATATVKWKRAYDTQ